MDSPIVPAIEIRTPASVAGIQTGENNKCSIDTFGILQPAAVDLAATALWHQPLFVLLPHLHESGDVTKPFLPNLCHTTTKATSTHTACGVTATTFQK